MILFTAYEDYFMNLATKFKSIAHTATNRHFATMDIDDILSAQRGDLDFETPCLILENFEGEMEFKHDKFKDEAYGAFHVIMRVQRNSPENKRNVMNLTKLLGWKIIAKIQKDKEKLHHGDKTGPPMLLYFNINDVKYNKISNIFSDCHGYRFEFNLGQEATNPYLESDWE